MGWICSSDGETKIRHWIFGEESIHLKNPERDGDRDIEMYLSEMNTYSIKWLMIVFDE
jgi:hypothetical protein